MKPTPWSEEAIEPGEHQAAAALATIQTEPAPWSSAQTNEVFQAIHARTAAASGAQPHHLVLAASVIALLAVVVMARRPSPSSVAAPTIEASADARYRLTAPSEGHPTTLNVKQGAVQVRSSSVQRVELETPALRGHLDAQEFRVQVAGMSCALSVDRGNAEILALDGHVVRLASGQAIHSSDARLHPAPTPTPAAPPAHRLSEGSCSVGSLEARRACYLRATRGDDLGAQNAVLELGMLEQEEAHDGPAALDAWRSYQTRFPSGPLAPEASVAILGELLAEHRVADARQEAEDFLRRYPDDGRAAEVRRLLAE